MRLYSFAVKGQIRLGAELAGRLVDVNPARPGRADESAASTRIRRQDAEARRTLSLRIW